MILNYFILYWTKRPVIITRLCIVKCCLSLDPYVDLYVVGSFVYRIVKNILPYSVSAAVPAYGRERINSQHTHEFADDCGRVSLEAESIFVPGWTQPVFNRVLYRHTLPEEQWVRWVVRDASHCPAGGNGRKCVSINLVIYCWGVDPQCCFCYGTCLALRLVRPMFLRTLELNIYYKCCIAVQCDAEGAAAVQCATNFAALPPPALLACFVCVCVCVP